VLSDTPLPQEITFAFDITPDGNTSDEFVCFGTAATTCTNITTSRDDGTCGAVGMVACGSDCTVARSLTLHDDVPSCDLDGTTDGTASCPPGCHMELSDDPTLKINRHARDWTSIFHVQTANGISVLFRPGSRTLHVQSLPMKQVSNDVEIYGYRL
jgi:hypothetical protein